MTHLHKIVPDQPIHPQNFSWIIFRIINIIIIGSSSITENTYTLSTRAHTHNEQLNFNYNWQTRQKGQHDYLPMTIATTTMASTTTTAIKTHLNFYISSEYLFLAYFFLKIKKKVNIETLNWFCQHNKRSMKKNFSNLIYQLNSKKKWYLANCRNWKMLNESWIGWNRQKNWTGWQKL